MDQDYFNEIKETLDDAEDIKKRFKLESIDTALLILIRQDIEDIRFNTSK